METLRFHSSKNAVYHALGFLRAFKDERRRASVKELRVSVTVVLRFRFRLPMKNAFASNDIPCGKVKLEIAGLGFCNFFLSQQSHFFHTT